MAEEFAVPSGGRHPQARLVTLASCGTRHILAAAAGSYATSEQKLFDQTVGALRPGTLNLADRNFFSMARWVTAAATGAQLAWRVKNGVRSLPAKRLAVLPDGSSLLRLRESNSMLAARRAAAGDRSLPRLPDTVARLVEFDVQVADSAGRRRTSRFRVLTTLTDHHACPAAALAAVYAERWQVELAYYRMKVTLRGPGVVLRGQTPALARQEIWGCCWSTTACATWPPALRRTWVSTPTRSPSSPCSGTPAPAWKPQPAAAPAHGPMRTLRRCSPRSPRIRATGPAGSAPAPAPPANDEPNEPATSHTPSPSSRRIYPKPHENP